MAIELTVTNTPEITNRREFDEIYAVINDKKNIKVRDLSKNLASTTKYIEFYLKDIDLGTTKIYCRIKRFKNIYRKEVKEEFVTNSVYVEVASNEIMFVNEERFCPAHKIKLKKVPIHYGLKCPKEQKEKGEIICGGCVISPKSEKFAYICPVDHWIWERVME